MELPSLLSNIASLLLKILDSLKLFFAGLYIRRSTRIEVEKNVLQKVSQIQSKQNDIAADAPDRPSALRDRMRSDGF